MIRKEYSIGISEIEQETVLDVLPLYCLYFRIELDDGYTVLCLGPVRLLACWFVTKSPFVESYPLSAVRFLYKETKYTLRRDDASVALLKELKADEIPFCETLLS